MNKIQHRKIHLFKVISVLICYCSIAFAQTAKTATVQSTAPAQSTANLIAELQKLLSAEVAANPSLPGELLHVHAPKRGIDISLAAGVFDRESKRPLDPHHLFRVASVTKTFVAASMLRLYEEGKIKLDDPINRYLPKEYNAVLDAGG